MTQMSIAEQSFLKLDAPQQARPAATKAVSGAGFGNVMAEARDSRPAENAPATQADTSDNRAAEPEAAAKTEAANSDSAPAKGNGRDVQAAKTADADGQTAETGEDLLPVIARLPEGGLTTKAATSETAISRMTAKTSADGETAAVDAGQPAEDITETVARMVGKETSDLPQNTEGTADRSVLRAVDAAAMQKAEGSAATNGADMIQPDQADKLKSLNTTTSTAALTAQQSAADAAAQADGPATTHASLSLRAQIAATPMKPQTVTATKVKTDAAADDTAVTGAKVTAETGKVDGEAQAIAPELAGLQLETDAPAKAAKDLTANADQPVEIDAETASTDTIPLAAAGAAVAAPIAARQSDTAQPASRQPKAAPLMAGDRQPNTGNARGDAQQIAMPQATQRVGKATQGDGMTIEPATKAKGTEAKPSLAATSFEQAIQQVGAQDTGIDLTEVVAKTVDLPQQAAAPQQPLGAVAPQVQVTNAPESFQQIEAAARDVATSELAMDQAEWPENLVENIGFETLADGEAMDIQLTPENLGRVQLRMELRDGAASITIVTETSEAAKQFNDNQQKLADLLAKQGVELANHNASTGRDSGRNDQGGQTGSAQANNNQSDAANGTGETEAVSARKDPNRLVDVQA